MLTLGTRIEASYLALGARVTAISVGVITLVIQHSMAADSTGRLTTWGAGSIVAPALLLLMIAAASAVPFPSIPAWVSPLVEVAGAALVVSSSPEHLNFLLYLLIPVISAGLTAGVVASLCTAATAWIVILGMAAGVGPERVTTVWGATGLMVPVFIVTAWIAAWLRRIRQEEAGENDVAYASAHRLLSELHVVARQLSLGLDPQTLAAALIEDVRTLVPGATCTVLNRSAGGRFLPLVGSDQPDVDLETLQDAWRSARTVNLRADARHVTVLPVRMGARVVALVILTHSEPLESGLVQEARAAIDQAGPRLASAMLFDDVRRLATADERMRLAREIHDGIAQDLASLTYLIDDLRNDVDEEAAQRVIVVRDQLRTMVSDLRLSIFDLRNSVDDTVSLGAALSEYAHRVGSQAGLVVHVSIEETTQRMPIATEVEILRMAQEAITNVRKHACARNLWVTVQSCPPHARITLTDDGVGLGTGRPDSMGITGMHERARRIGADLSIGRAPNGGTLVEITVPAGWDWLQQDATSASWLSLTGPPTGELPMIRLPQPQKAAAGTPAARGEQEVVREHG